jgi:hypothetical protein
MRSLILFYFVTAVIPSFSQYNCGLKIGVNYSTIQAKPRDYQWGPSYHLGLYQSYSINDRVFIVNEVLYNDKVKKSEKYNTHFAYIGTYLLTKFNIIRKLAIEGGAGFNRLLFMFEKHGHTYINQMYRRTNIDLLLGVQYQLTSRLNAALRYEHGLTNLISKDAIAGVNYQYIQNGDPLLNPPTWREEGYDERHRNIQLSIFYSLTNN